MSDYLFDGNGDPDPEIEQLERSLAPLAYRGERPRMSEPRRRRRAPLIGSVAAVAAAAASLVLLWPSKKPMPPKTGWPLAVLRGTATIEQHVVAVNEPLGVSEWLETGAGRARLDVPGMGIVELGPGSRARIATSSASLREIELSSGKLSAHIEAPSRRFAVKLPHARVVDLGCAFTIELDEDGRGRVVVSAGAVEVSDDSAQPTAPVAAGQTCDLDPRGHGVPHPLPSMAATPVESVRGKSPSVPHVHAKPVELPTHTPIGPGDDAPARGPTMRDSFR